MDRKKLLAANLLATNCILLRRQRRRRLYQVHPINQKRAELSEFRIFDELLIYPARFKSYLRMGPDEFFYLLDLLKDGYILVLFFQFRF